MEHYFLLLICLLTTGYAEKATFKNYKLFRMQAADREQRSYLQRVTQDTENFQFLRGPNHMYSSVDILVPPHKLTVYEETVRALNLTSELLIEDIQMAIDNETSDVSVNKKDYDWKNYYPLDNIYEWLDSLALTYPNQVSSIIGGSTYEGRKIKGVKVSYKKGNPGVFIEGGIHACEWIAPATVTFILNQLLTSKDPDVRDIAENYDWYIFPIVNPDGYEYSHTSNRLWRKTRSPSSETCFGVDPNRNWDFHWMGMKGSRLPFFERETEKLLGRHVKENTMSEGGSSSNPCNSKYAGPKPFSEIETRSLSEFITSIADKFDVYLSFHSYSQMLLLPYGYTNERIHNYDVLMEIGNKSMTSLSKRYATEYEVGNIVDLLFVASGGSLDWVRGTFNTTITYGYELRDRTSFILPASQIIPSGEETLDSLVTMLQEARKIIPKV